MFMHKFIILNLLTSTSVSPALASLLLGRAIRREIKRVLHDAQSVYHYKKATTTKNIYLNDKA